MNASGSVRTVLHASSWTGRTGAALASMLTKSGVSASQVSFFLVDCGGTQTRALAHVSRTGTCPCASTPSERLLAHTRSQQEVRARV
eukprot:1190956-Pleurochrysis_carterae.AAC.2